MARYYDGGTIPWVKSGELRENVIMETAEHVTQVALIETNVQLVPPGALLLALYGATVGRLGMLGVPATTNQAVCHIIPDELTADVRYLFHWLAAQAPSLVASGVGGAQPNISQGLVKNLVVPLPPLAEQRRIARVLDLAEHARTVNRASDVLCARLFDDVFTAMFGDPLNGRRDWKRCTLREIVTDLRIGPFGSALHKSDYIEGGVPIINPMHIGPRELQPSPNFTVGPNKHAELIAYHLRPGDLVMARRGEMGRCAIVREEHRGFVCGTGSMIIRPDPTVALPTYLHGVLTSSAMRRHLERMSLGATMANLNRTQVAMLDVNVPPIGAQRRYEAAILRIAALDSMLERRDDSLTVLFASLQHRAFAGTL